MAIASHHDNVRLSLVLYWHAIYEYLQLPSSFWLRWADFQLIKKHREDKREEQRVRFVIKR